MPSFDPFVRAEAPRPCEGADRGRQLSGIAHFGILPIPLKEMRCGGVLEFSEIRSAAGREWTDDGQVHEVRRPKGGPRNAVRGVPVPPVLVELLREHIQEFGTAPDGRLFRTYRGATYLPSTLWQVLPKARRPYDFRHAGVSWRLNAGTRRRRWPSGPGTPSRCCSGSMRTASTATMSVRPDGRSSWLASALCTGLGSTLGEGC